MSRTPARSAAPSNRSGAGRTISGSDKDQPLIDDIRLLGRVLGDVIREQEGQAAYDLIEQIRQLSVAYRRQADQDADKALKKLLKGLSGQQTVSVIRAFTYFSHLANLAEDRHHIRRRAVHERAGDTQEGSIEVALSRLRWAGIAPKTISQTLAGSYVAPVLTAHPTEVQRKSILDAERAIAHLLDDSAGAEPAAEERSERLGALNRHKSHAPIVRALAAKAAETVAGPSDRPFARRTRTHRPIPIRPRVAAQSNGRARSAVFRSGRLRLSTLTPENRLRVAVADRARK